MKPIEDREHQEGHLEGVKEALRRLGEADENFYKTFQRVQNSPELWERLSGGEPMGVAQSYWDSIMHESARLSKGGKEHRGSIEGDDVRVTWDRRYVMEGSLQINKGGQEMRWLFLGMHGREMHVFNEGDCDTLPTKAEHTIAYTDRNSKAYMYKMDGSSVEGMDEKGVQVITREERDRCHNEESRINRELDERQRTFKGQLVGLLGRIVGKGPVGWIDVDPRVATVSHSELIRAANRVADMLEGATSVLEKELAVSAEK